MEITFDKASKFYEPGEKVSGMLTLKEWGTKFTELKGFTLKAESYMDTVSQIRGSQGRPPLEESKRTYFMKKNVDFSDVQGQKGQKTFSFILEATETGEKLLDTYVGVEFSILVSTIHQLNYPEYSIK